MCIDYAAYMHFMQHSICYILDVNIICKILHAAYHMPYKSNFCNSCRPLACESPQSVGLVTADDLIFIVVESLDMEELESECDFLIDILTSFTLGTWVFIGFGWNFVLPTNLTFVPFLLSDEDELEELEELNFLSLARFCDADFANFDFDIVGCSWIYENGFVRSSSCDVVIV